MKYTVAFVLASGLLANALPTAQPGAEVDAVEKRTFLPIFGSGDLLAKKCAVSLLRTYHPDGSLRCPRSPQSYTCL